MLIDDSEKVEEKMNPFKKMNKEHALISFGQFLKFGIVGISNTFVGLMVYYILVYFGVHYIIANTMGFMVSVLNAYYWNNRYVFKKQTSRSAIDVLIKVYIVYGMSFILNTGLLFIMVNFLDISKYVAPVINLFIITPINFWLNKHWAFN